MTSRALRIGVLIGDSLVEDKLFDGTTPITFGHSLRCALSIPVDGVPLEHVLFTYDRGRFALHPAPGIAGQLGRDGVITKLAGDAPIALARGTRGRLTIGDATLLFQEVARPAPAPLPKLPASLRVSLADRVDRRLALVIGGSLAVHIAIAVWAWNTAPQTSLLDPPQAAQFERATIDVDDVLTPPAPDPAPSAAIPLAPTQTPTRMVRPTRAIVPVQHDAPPRLDDATRLASILASGETSPGGVGGMQRRHPGVDLDKQLDEARHHPVTIGGGPTSRDPRFSIADDPHRELPLSDPSVDPLHLPTRPDAERGRIRPFEPKSDEPTSLGPQVVLERINALYMAGLERCYRKGLAGDATLGGRVSLSFTINDAGHVIDPEAAGVEAQVDHCISSLMATWRFPIPRDGKGEPTDTTFHVSLALQPN